MSVVMIALGVLLDQFSVYVISKIRLILQIRELRKAVTPHVVVKERLCKTQHSFMPAPVTTPMGMEQIEVCRICGYINGTDKMAPQESLDRIEENNRHFELEQKLYKEFLEQEDTEIKKFFKQEIDAGMNFEKLLHLHSAGMNFGERFALYKMHKSKETEEQMFRGNA